MLNYIQYDKHWKILHNLGVSTVNIFKKHSDVKVEKAIIEEDFGPTPNILKRNI